MKTSPGVGVSLDSRFVYIYISLSCSRGERMLDERSNPVNTIEEVGEEGAKGGG